MASSTAASSATHTHARTHHDGEGEGRDERGKPHQLAVETARFGCVFCRQDQTKASIACCRAGPAGVCAQTSAMKAFAAHALSGCSPSCHPSMFRSHLNDSVRLVNPELLFAAVFLPDDCRKVWDERTHSWPFSTIHFKMHACSPGGGHEFRADNACCALLQECPSSKTTENGPIVSETRCLTGLGMDKTRTLPRSVQI